VTSESTSPYPEFFPVRQNFQKHAINDIPAAIAETVEQSPLSEIKTGQRVAIAVGSRGIANLSTIISTVVQLVSDRGGRPVIVPAMGSHGGATSEGQKAVLASYGISSDQMGCPVDASMETVLVGTTSDGVDVHFDRVASEADHVVVVNRVKPHTRLAGKYESGLVKMLMIGLGKHRGAYLYHQVFPDYDHRLELLAPEIVSMIVQQVPIIAGIAIVEDAFENTSHIEAIAASEFLSREPELLEMARNRMPRLPFDHADLLIVDQIGKEISGCGMDTNVIGRKTNDRSAAPDEFPKIRQIYVRSLTEKTAGNGCGVGIADYGHRKVVNALNEEVTRINCVTSAHVTAGAIPITFDSDQEVLDAVVSQTQATRRADLNWLWIRDTLQLSELACSRSYWEAAIQRADLELLGEPSPLCFDDSGNLASRLFT
jgi:hypothetical protein